MILRILISMLTMTVCLTAAQESKNAGNLKAIPESACVNCNNCRQRPSEAELFSQVQAVLNADILLSPLLRAQLIQQLQQLVTEGGIVPGGGTGILDFADFFALMPPDNAATVSPGTDVQFPQNGPTSASAIARVGPSTFKLSAIGTYQVMFQVSVNEPGQLVLVANGAEQAYTVVGRQTGSSQMVGTALITTTVADTILSLRNPAASTIALTITPDAGGIFTSPVSAHLVITRLR